MVNSIEDRSVRNVVPDASFLAILIPIIAEGGSPGSVSHHQSGASPSAIMYGHECGQWMKERASSRTLPSMNDADHGTLFPRSMFARESSPDVAKLVGQLPESWRTVLSG